MANPTRSLQHVPQIKSEDREALQKFSVLLTSCRNTLKGTEYLSKIDNPDSLRGIVNRLPHFVEREARAATHPVFGDISGNLKDKESHRKKPPVRFKGSTMGDKSAETISNKIEF